jgi:hypothetical protein
MHDIWQHAQEELQADLSQCDMEESVLVCKDAAATHHGLLLLLLLLRLLLQLLCLHVPR